MNIFNFSKKLTNKIGAISFDFIDDKLQRTDAVITAYPFSMYVKFKLLNTSNTSYLISVSKTSTSGNYTFLTASNNDIAWQIRSNSGPTPNAEGFVVMSTGSTITDTDWHTLIAVSRASNDHELYLDGSSIGTSSVNATFPTTPNRTSVGHWVRSGSTGFADAEIDEAAIWSVDLSTSEITSINNGSKGTVSSVQAGNLEMYTPLNDHPVGGSGDGLTFADDSGNGNDLTGDDGANNTGLQITASPPEEITISESIELTENSNINPSLLKINVSENIDLTETLITSPASLTISESIELTENVTASAPQEANNASKIIRYNPLIFITNTDPAKIVEVDISDPENPTHIVTELTGASFATDVARNSVTGFLYVSCANGIVVKVDETDLNSQTIIDLSDSDELQTMEVLDNFGLAYTSTDSSTGELYIIDERTTVIGDFRLDVLSQQTFTLDSEFTCIESFHIDSDFQVLSLSTSIINCDFKCISSPIDDIEPIKRNDFVLFLDSIQVENFDVDLSSITITHTIDQESQTTFRLNRKHDQINLDLEGNSRPVTSQNAVKITIQGVTEFDGFVSELDCQYGENEEFIIVTAKATEKVESYNNVTLSLAGLNSRLGLYDVMIQNPRIFNPKIDVDAENPVRFKGIRVPLGQKREQSFSRHTQFDSLGRIAEDIQEGTFIPKQNWTYFWSPTVTNFDPNFTPGQTRSITFLYIGTSLSPVSEDLWVLDNAKHRRQRQFEDIITRVGTTGTITQAEINNLNLPESGSTLFSSLQSAGYINGSGTLQPSFINNIFDPEDLNIDFSLNTKNGLYNLLDSAVGYYVGEAPFKQISPRNGVFNSKFHWVDEDDGLYSIKESSFNFTEFAKEVGDLEYQKMLNINGEILPETSCSLSLTIDGYYYNSLTLLTRINIDNTTQSGIYKDSNGFPVSIKSITISSDSMKCSITADNLRSNIELEALDGQFPDEFDDRFNEEERRILVAPKTDMKTRLRVQ